MYLVGIYIYIYILQNDTRALKCQVICVSVVKISIYFTVCVRACVRAYVRFVKIGARKTPTLLRGLKNFYPPYPHLLSDLGEVRYIISTRDAVECLHVL